MANHNKNNNVLRGIGMLALICIVIGYIFAVGRQQNAQDPVEEYEPSDGASIAEGDLALGGFAVSSSSAEASEIGMQVLADGGNAVDAAVAMSFALGVSEPYASGLGGGGVMVIYDPATDESYYLDYYGCAGSAETMQDAVAIPGLVRGMEAALENWGSISLGDAIEPAAQLAENGFEASESLISRLEYSEVLQENASYAGIEEGDLVVQTELAETLRAIQEEGADVFYSGYIAEDIANACALTTSDMEQYKVSQNKPIRSKFNDYTIVTSGAPTSGVTVAQMLAMADARNIPSAEQDPQGYLDILKECSEKAYDVRTSIVVDPSYYEFDGEEYVSEEYISEQLADDTASTEEEQEKFCTLQFSVIDGSGMIVSVTNTLSDSWGCYELVDGFYLNNSLTNFSESGKNAYEAGKRPRTYIAPTLVLGEDGYCLAIGSPGGNYIPRIIVPVLIDILQNGTDAQTAVDKSRAMFDSDGNLCLETEDHAPSVIDKDAITQSYYSSSNHLMFGCTSIVGYDPENGIFCASDSRRETSKVLVYQQ